MENSNCMVVIAVVAAVTGGVALISFQVQRRLSSDFFKKLESEIGGERSGAVRGKKKVRFAPDVAEPSANNKEYRRRMETAALARGAGKIAGGGR